jgi:hypothetical protein
VCEEYSQQVEHDCYAGRSVRCDDFLWRISGIVDGKVVRVLPPCLLWCLDADLQRILLQT